MVRRLSRNPAWALKTRPTAFPDAFPDTTVGMSYSCCQKWRPMDFEDIVGQEHSRRRWQKRSHHRVAHALVPLVVSGVGKTPARAYWPKADCVKGPTRSPAWFAAGTEITAARSRRERDEDASRTGVDTPRAQERLVTGRSAIAADLHRDEGHMLSQSVERVLKTLEEPRPREFIFATTEGPGAGHHTLARHVDFK